MPNNKHITVDQVIEVLADLQTKADGRFRALVTKIVESDLGTDLATKINGKADQTDLSSLSDKVDVLIGTETGDNAKSVRTISAEEVAKVVAGAPASYDTLKEIADWIVNDTTGAAKMANDISALKTKATLGTDGSGNEYATVKAYVEAYVADVVGAAYTGGDGIEVDSNRAINIDLVSANGLGIDANGKLNIGAASASSTGALSSTDWSTFNGKQDALSAGTGVDATSFASGTIALTPATSSAAGSMSAADKAKLDSFEEATATDIAAIKATIWPSA